MALQKGWLDFLREQYPAGSRIRLSEMKDPYTPVPPGTMGTLDCIDDQGTFHVTWDNGRSLGLIIGEDRFQVLPPETQTVKLYMPLYADIYEADEWGGYTNESYELGGQSLLDYEAQIRMALMDYRMPEEAERGIMHWYSDKDSVNEKVKSVVFEAETRNGQLWGVANCKIAGTLNDREMERLKDYISGQASDGWGEGFEQRGIETGEGEMYVHLWSWDSKWNIQTEEERFGPKLADGLPEMCFSVLQSTGELICIKRGESGYYPSDWNTDDPKHNAELADYNNARLGVTPAQRQAMEVGSMHGWNVPGADPAAYENKHQTMGGMQFGQ